MPANAGRHQGHIPPVAVAYQANAVEFGGAAVDQFREICAASTRFA